MDKTDGSNRRSRLSLVVSVFNEEESLPLFRDETEAILNDCGWDYELIYVNDGSGDGSAVLLNRMAAENPRVKVLHFSRNFGHEAAMIAGIDCAEGDAVICMDADLQHPPRYIPKMLALFEAGTDVIHMVRTANRSAGFLKNLTSAGFYAVMNTLSGTRLRKNESDFFGLSARTAEILRRDYRERVRFLRGYVQSLGFPSETLYYEAGRRAAGHSKYSIRRLLRFSMNTIMSFSDLPLRLGIYAGACSALLGVLILFYSLVMKVKNGAPDGYTTLIVVICFMFAVLFLLVGIIGQYIGVLFQEVKGRPIYLIESAVNVGTVSTDRTAPKKKIPEA